MGDGGYDANLPYGPTQVNQPLSGAAEGGGSSLVGAGSDSRRQAKLMLAWGFLLVGVALILRSILFTRSEPTTVSAGAATDEPGIAPEATAEKNDGLAKSRRSSRRKN
jgi:hypothetical protein